MNEIKAITFESNGKILKLLADIQKTSAPIELSIGWTDGSGTVRDGIVIKSAPPLVAEKLVEAGYSLDIMPQGVRVCVI